MNKILQHLVFFLLMIHGLPVFTEPLTASKVEVRSADMLTPGKIDSINKSAFDLVFSDQVRVMRMMHETYLKAWAINDTNGYLNSLNILGIAHDIKGNLDSSEYYFSKTLDLSRKYKRPEYEEKSTNNLGMMNWNKGNLFLAQQYFYSALKLTESQKNERRTAVALSNIGLIYQELFMYEKALPFHRRALSIRFRNPELKRDVTLSLNNMAICFEHVGKLDSAIMLIRQGLTIAREINNKQVEGNLLTTLANCYYDQKDYRQALNYCLQSVDVQKESGIEKSLNKTYNSVCDIYIALGQPKLALEYALKAKDLLNRYNSNHDWIVYYQLAKAYFHLGNKELGESYFQRSNELKDSIFSQSHARSFAELEVMHEAKQKEEALNNYKIELAEEQLKVQKRNFFLILLGVGIFIFAVLSIGYYKKQKFKKEQFQKELVLQEKLAKAEMQNQLNQERMRISKDLHDNIGSQLTLVSSSLDNLTYKMGEPEAKQRVTQISAFAKIAMSQLRDSIWALNRNEFTLEDFHLRVLDFINKAKQSFPEFKFENRMEGNKSLLLTPELGINLLYIIQEIIHNALKYSKGTHLNYQLSSAGNQIHIQLSDNGRGFRKEQVELGNGLKNIDERIQKINGTYTLKTGDGIGTRYQFTVNI